MKKSLIALAILAASGAAMAQSTVTISGVLDVGLTNVNKVAAGANNTSVGSGNNARINFSVVEDLGGGLKAIANAAMRFDPTTGTAEGANARPLFQGETRVGLSGGFGTVLLGRGLTAVQAANGGNSDPWGVSTVAAMPYAMGFVTDFAAGNEGRIDKGIFYTSPSISGLTLSGSFSPRKNQATAGNGLASKTHLSVNALYANGPLVAALGKEANRAGDTLTQVYGNYDLVVAKVFASYATIKGGTTAQRAQAGTFAATAGAVQSGNGGVGPVAIDGSINNSLIGATIPMGTTTIRVGYSSWNGNGAAGQARDNKVGLGAKFDLSKRTYVYTDLASQTRKNNTGTAADGKDNTSIRSLDLGVAHSF